MGGSTIGGKFLTGGTDVGPSGTAGATATGFGFSGILVPGLRATAKGTPFGAVGSGVEHVRFGEDLDFAVKPRRGQQVSRGKAVRQLSSGARDQLHLAVRLAISEYLSREEALPILVDDCFATSDDTRARAGMKLLIEQIAPHHQVLVVTCHRKRHEALAALDHELFTQRVHWIDTQKVRSRAEAATHGS